MSQPRASIPRRVASGEARKDRAARRVRQRGERPGQLVFNVLQTYSGGEKVNWNEISADPSVEPEHPAPILSIAPAAAETGAGASDPVSQADRNGQVTTADQSGNASDSMLPLALSGVALALSLVALVVAWRRRPLPPAAPAASEPSREDVDV